MKPDHLIRKSGGPEAEQELLFFPFYKRIVIYPGAIIYEGNKLGSIDEDK